MNSVDKQVAAVLNTASVEEKTTVRELTREIGTMICDIAEKSNFDVSVISYDAEWLYGFCLL